MEISVGIGLQFLYLYRPFQEQIDCWQVYRCLFSAIGIPQALPCLIRVELIIVAQFGCLFFFTWTEMYSKLHFSLAPSMFCIKLRKQVQKIQSTPPSRCKYKYPIIPLAQTPETNSDLRFSIASYIKSTATYFLHLSGFYLLHTPKYFLSGLTNLKRSHYNLFRWVWLTACQLGLTDGCWIVVAHWVSWIFHSHKKCRH